LLALISAGFAGQAGAAAARVDFTTEGVTVAGRDGLARPLRKGSDLDSGDTVRTSAAGRAQLRFNDGSYVSLQPNTDFAINEYKYEGKDDDRGFFGLVRGAMRTVTGAVGRVNRNSYRITTPTATVGIRGTGGVIQVLNDGSTLVIGTSGIWSLTNPSGSIDIPAGVSGLAPRETNTPPRETNTQPQTKPADVPPPKNLDYKKGDETTEDGTSKVVADAIEAATPPPPPIIPLVSGSGYAPALGFNLQTGPSTQAMLDGGLGGFSQSTAGDAVFNAQGQLTALTLGPNVYKLEAGGSHADFGTDGVLAWGRWIGAVSVTGSACIGNSATCNVNYGPNDGLHYVIGAPTPIMPVSGTATYTLMGATQPTYVNGVTAPGTFSGTLTAQFSPSGSTVQGSFAAAMPDRTYSWSATGGGSGPFFSMTASTVSGCANPGSNCSAQMTGFFSGANADRAGVAYKVQDLNSDFIGNKLVGAAAFKKSP
jgi:hypothetical protein